MCTFVSWVWEHPNSIDAAITRSYLRLLGEGAPELSGFLALALLFNKGTPDGSKRFWFGQNILEGRMLTDDA